MKKCECSTCHTDNSGASVIENEDACASADCGCESGHEHDHGHSHTHGDGANELTSLRQDVTAVAASAVLSAVAALMPAGWAKTLLFFAAVLTAGFPVFKQGIKNIIKLDFEEMALLTIAVTAASIIGELPEAVIVTILFRLGEMLEDIAASRSRREIEAVTNIIPDSANLILSDGTAETVSAKALKPGDKIMLKSGERVPVDCVILSGESSMDSSSITGESAPGEVSPGDSLLSGMVNIGGVLTCEATNTADNSAASRIVQMVKESAAKKCGTERMITRFARIYTPVVIVIAALVTAIPPLFGFGHFSIWLSRALVFLVAACPCALVIATPLAFFAGIGGASKQGVLIKGSKYIEVLAGTKAVVFDKTGTLTTGNLKVSQIFTTNGATRDEVLRLAAVCENASNHPIAKAIVAKYEEKIPPAESCEEITAYGMKAVVDGDEILCGSVKLMEKYSVDIGTLPSANVYIAKNSKAIGAVSVFDAPREDAAGMVKSLKRLGIRRTVMLTGDSQAAASKAAELIGIAEVHAELLPQDKVEHFLRVKSEIRHGKVLFTGDGINDSPVIAASDAGLAMGISSDAAIEAADVVLLSDKLSSLPQAIRIAKRTTKLAVFNIAFALAVKLIVFALALMGMASMWMAVFADVGVSILTVLNATRALNFK